MNTCQLKEKITKLYFYYILTKEKKMAYHRYITLTENQINNMTDTYCHLYDGWLVKKELRRVVHLEGGRPVLDFHDPGKMPQAYISRGQKQIQS